MYKKVCDAFWIAWFISMWCEGQLKLNLYRVRQKYIVKILSNSLYFWCNGNFWVTFVEPCTSRKQITVCSIGIISNKNKLFWLDWKVRLCWMVSTFAWFDSSRCLPMGYLKKFKMISPPFSTTIWLQGLRGMYLKFDRKAF